MENFQIDPSMGGVIGGSNPEIPARKSENPEIPAEKSENPEIPSR